MTINASKVKILIFEPITWKQKACDNVARAGISNKAFVIAKRLDTVQTTILTRMVLRQLLTLFICSSSAALTTENQKHVLAIRMFWQQHNPKQHAKQGDRMAEMPQLWIGRFMVQTPLMHSARPRSLTSLSGFSWSLAQI